jgi:hypothetical protein
MGAETMTTIPPSGDPRIDELLDSLRAAGVPEDGLLDELKRRLANAVSDEPDWVTHCETCSALYNGALDGCPENKRHRTRKLDANSSAFRGFVAGRRESITDTDIGE